MKNSILKPAFLTVLSALAFISCVNDDSYSTPNLDCIETSLIKTKEVSDIPASATVTQYTEDEVIEAYVTSSDRDGNFYKSISMQTLDGSDAFSIPVDATSTFVNFEPGRKVLIKMKNLYTDVKYGGMRIGGIYLDTDGSVEVGRIPATDVRSILFPSCTILNEEELIQSLTIAELLNDNNLNKLVELDGVQFTSAALGKNYYDPTNDIGGATNHYLEDAAGNTVIFRTSSFASFAHHAVASGNGKVRGVLTKYNSDYQFMARYESDVILDGNRIEAVFSEDFQSATNNTNLDIPGWTNFAESGSWVWREKTFSGNGYAEFSAFNAQALNVVWLVTPAIDLATFSNKQLQFKVAQHHLDVDSPDNSLEVLISTDYDGTNVLGATWTTLSTPNLPTMATSWYEFLSSSVDISAYNGTVYVAFKFRGSGTNTTLDGAFQVDDVKVFAQ
ncbi:DUF5689 domain-containing protein [Flavobacterium chuncheonense]|uniref:DUF5689 domain-containing protein n=1 Tax=Flavobacterium chuncheonense TaxID=2026653 RepID=A0ABW5YMI3_9FLAO